MLHSRHCSVQLLVVFVCLVHSGVCFTPVSAGGGDLFTPVSVSHDCFLLPLRSAADRSLEHNVLLYSSVSCSNYPLYAAFYSRNNQLPVVLAVVCNRCALYVHNRLLHTAI